MKPKSNPTLRDVAKFAGVSHQTVSRVINHHERVSPETRARVTDAIAKLGFSPNAIARSMAQGRAHTLACLSPNLTDYTFASIIESAETETRQSGFFLLSASAPNEKTFATLVEQLVARRRADGLMVINPYMDQRYTHLPADFPIVFVGARPRQEAANSVALDDEHAARIATQYLIDVGHRRIALINGPLVEDCSQDRYAGYLAVLQASGVDYTPALVVEGDWSGTSGYEAMRRLLAQSLEFTAVFAQNDRMAVGAIRALREAGRRVPDDVSIMGFDDMPLASYCDPPLTTMRQDLARIGREAARLLVREVDRPEAACCEHLSLPAELVVRGSTARPNGS